jgi:hypothetical protein
VLEFNPLAILAGTADPGLLDASLLPASEQYAWIKFRQRLGEEGCLGTSEYLQSVSTPVVAPDLVAMSPLESATAESRAAELVATQLDNTEALLACN